MVYDGIAAALLARAAANCLSSRLMVCWVWPHTSSTTPLARAADLNGCIGQVERLTLEAQHVGDPALPHSSAPGPTWKPNPVALWVKPATAPTRVLLQGTPLSRGLYVLTGCRMTVLGVTWLQPWVPRKPSLGALRPFWPRQIGYPWLEHCRLHIIKFFFDC